MQGRWRQKALPLSDRQRNVSRLFKDFNELLFLYDEHPRDQRRY